MALEHRLDLRISQKLVLTPQLQLAIKLLQQTQLELVETINQELMENPFLEENIDNQDESSVEVTDYSENNQDFDSEREIDYDKLLSFSNDEYFQERASDGRDLGYFGTDNEEMPSYESFYAKKPDIKDHLLFQLRFADGSEELKKVAQAVIANLDEDGYLRVSEEEIANASKELIIKGIKLVQSFDPPGVAARDLQECLLLQLKSLSLEGTIVEKIIREHLQDVEKRKYQAIAKRLNISEEDVKNAIAIIEKKLEPRPCSQYSSNKAIYVIPDVIVEPFNNDYRIIINDERIPRIKISKYYKKLLYNSLEFVEEEFTGQFDLKKLFNRLHKDGFILNNTIEDLNRLLKNPNFYERVINKYINQTPSIKMNELIKSYKSNKKEDTLMRLNRLVFEEYYPDISPKNIDKRLLSKEERDFLEEKFKRAKDLTKSLDERNRTIYRVTESVLKFQRDFFDYGIQHVKPLNLREVADDLNVHECTISRATSNKWLACNHGIFSFRFFFSSSLKSEEGDISSTVVKEHIKQIVADEDPLKPLSDQTISDLLKQKGITVARRTVAKYREILKIQPQHKRKKF